MGCAASAPETVIDGTMMVKNLNAGDTCPLSPVPLGKESDKTNKEPTVDETPNATDKKECDNGFASLEEQKEPIIIKADTHDLIQPFNDASSEEGIRTDCKKGYVAFEVNLDGVIEPALDPAKRPLPKRLKVINISSWINKLFSIWNH